jgi:tRNA (cmo5U34)-methyltransferase
MTKPKDNVFDFKDKKVEDFKFNTQVVSVFDDMVTRSVPYYEEMQRMISELAKDFVSPNSNVYDIGCSTATTFCLLDKVITEPNVNFIGYDNSNEMIKKAKEKLKENGVKREVSFECSDLNKNSLRIENASLITFILTLQFIRPLNREKIMKQIFDGLNDNGALILVEKVTSEDTIFNRLFINHYYDFNV